MEVELRIKISQFYNEEYVYGSDDLLYQPITPYKNWMELVVNSINNLNEEEICDNLYESGNNNYHMDIDKEQVSKTIKELCNQNKLEERIDSVMFGTDYDCIIMYIYIEI